MNIINKTTTMTNKRIALVVAKFYEDIADALIDYTRSTLERKGIKEEHIDIVYVPGAFEIPFTVNKLLLSKRYDALITLGAVIRGETPHFDYVAAECAQGVSRLAVHYDVPVIFGVLTTDNKAQAYKRAGINADKTNNKGVYAAQAAIDMMALCEQI